MPYGFEVKNGKVSVTGEGNIYTLVTAVNRGKQDALDLQNQLIKATKARIKSQRGTLYYLRRTTTDPLQKSFIEQELRELSTDVANLRKDPARTLANIYSRKEPAVHTAEARANVAKRTGEYLKNKEEALKNGITVNVAGTKVHALSKAEIDGMDEIYKILTGKSFDELVDEKILKEKYIKDAEKRELYRAIDQAFTQAQKEVEEALRFTNVTPEQLERIQNVEGYQTLLQSMRVYFQ